MVRRTLFGGLLTALGLAKSASAEPQPTMIDPRTILFSIPTLANDLPPLDALQTEPSDADLIFHEDDWRQIEFFAPDRRSEIQQALSAFKTFETSHRRASGWKNAYVRDLPLAPPVLTGADAIGELERLLAVSAAPAPILFSAGGGLHGRIRDGFTLPIGPGAALYGFTSGGGLPVLGAYLNNADDALLTQAFATLHRAHGLLLVDWRSQMMLQAVEPSGQLVVWSP